MLLLLHGRAQELVEAARSESLRAQANVPGWTGPVATTPPPLTPPPPRPRQLLLLQAGVEMPRLGVCPVQAVHRGLQGVLVKLGLGPPQGVRPDDGAAHGPVPAQLQAPRLRDVPRVRDGGGAAAGGGRGHETRPLAGQPAPGAAGPVVERVDAVHEVARTRDLRPLLPLHQRHAAAGAAGGARGRDEDDSEFSRCGSTRRGGLRGTRRRLPVSTHGAAPRLAAASDSLRCLQSCELLLRRRL